MNIAKKLLSLSKTILKGMPTMYNLIPMLALTGNPTREKIQNTLKGFCNIGIKAALLYPRSGCEVEYMSDRWFEVCRDAIDFARENGMKIWLYDDFNWPSGSCKGSVTKNHPEYIARIMCVENGEVKIKSALKDGMKPDAQILADVLNPDAVRCFIDSTHEVYYSHFGEDFGKTVEAFFTDEPSFCYNAKRARGEYPYYDGIEKDYAEKFRSDFMTDFLHYYNNDVKNAECRDFPKRYYDLLGERFAASYTGQLADWCEKHGILCTGHMLSDGHTVNGIEANGDIFKPLMEMQLPGIDDITTDFNGNEAILYSVASALRYNGKKHLMSELFAYGPCSMTYAAKKRQIMRNAMNGIGRYVLAISHLDARGNTVKSGYFNNFSADTPDCKFMKILSRDAEKAAHFASLDPIVDACVRFPRDEILSCFGNAEKEQEVNELYRQMLFALDEAQISYRPLTDDGGREDKHIFAISGGKIVEENSEMVFDGADGFTAWIKDNVITDAKICETDGTPAEGLLFMRYTNGEYMVIDRASKPHEKRNLMLVRNDIKREFELGCFGVYTGEKECDDVICEKAVDVSSIDIEYNSPSVKRLFTENGKAVFTLACDTDILLNKSAYPKEHPLSLDGEKIGFESSSTVLTPCFNDLYRKSEPLRLKKGEHIISTDTPDLPFFPAVVLEGDFDRRTLGKRPEKYTDDGVDFYGSVSLKFEVNADDNGGDAFIEFDQTAESMFPCELVIGGKTVGMCAYFPYRFMIPHEYTGKIRAELRFYSTYAPLFDRPYDRFRVIEDKKAMDEFRRFNAVPDVLKIKGLRITVKKHDEN